MAASSLMSAQTTLAPSWAKRMEVALPIPIPGPLEPAPAMRATFPFSLIPPKKGGTAVL